MIEKELKKQIVYTQLTVFHAVVPVLYGVLKWQRGLVKIPTSDPDIRTELSFMKFFLVL